MNINFDNFRMKGITAFNRLCGELNQRIHDDETIGDSLVRGDPLVVGDIYNEMDDLRDCMVTMACLEDKDNNIKCLDIEIEEFAPNLNNETEV